MPPDNRDLIGGTERRPQTPEGVSLEEMWNTQQADLRAIRRDIEKIQDAMSRMAFDESGRPMSQVDTQLATQGRRVRAGAEADVQRHSTLVTFAMSVISLALGGLVVAIASAHHWFGL